MPVGSDRSRNGSISPDGGVAVASRLQRGTTAAALAAFVGALAAWAVSYAELWVVAAAFAVGAAVAFGVGYTRRTWSTTVGAGLLVAATVVALAPVARYATAGFRWPSTTWIGVPGAAGTALWLAGFLLLAGPLATLGALFVLYSPETEG